QKNFDLLKLIIKTSSDEGDLVLDCFVGSGSTILAATELNRRWIGIDQSEYAIKVAKNKLSSLSPNLFSKQLDYDSFVLKDIKNE
ncbi:MAG: site-specific DNA-methyltransferase, partial [Candidatus Omnitrophica bacterium]|nr:site-specific DNA-methyltransferase [Candidatus Omnitrophota bacterium]